MASESRGLSRAIRVPPGLAAAVLALLTGTAAAAADSLPPTVAPPASEPPALLLVNERNPLEGVLTGGAPKDLEGFRELAAAGFHTFVDLRADAESLAEARGAAEGAGLVYESIPVSGEAEIDLASARRLEAVLDDVTRYPIAVACSSGNRAGALLAVESFWLDGVSPEAALALGKSAGLTRLEPSVRLLLGLPPAQEPPAKPAAPTP